MVDPGKKIIGLALGLLILWVTVSQMAWVIIDTRPQPFGDPYLPQTLRFYDEVSRDGLAAFSYESLGRLSVQGRPVLYQLMTLPFFRLLGRHEDSMLAVNLIFNVLLMLAVYRTTALIKNPWAGLLAALIVSAYPPISNLVKIARPQSVLPAFSALTLWLMFSMLKNPSRTTVWLWGTILGLSALIHPNGAQVFGPVALVFGVYLIYRRRERSPFGLWNRWVAPLKSRLLWQGLVPAGLIAFFSAAAWYLPHFWELCALARTAAASSRQLTDGFPGLERSLWWYGQTMPGALSWFFTMLLAVGVITFLFSRSRERQWLSLIVIMAMGILSTRHQGSFNWMYVAQILPAAGILTAVFVFDIRDWLVNRSGPGKVFFNIAGNGLVALTVLNAGFNFYVANAPSGNRVKKIVAIAGTADDQTCAWRMNVAFCPNPPVAQDWTAPEIVTAIGNDPQCCTQGCTLTMINKIFDQGLHQTNLAFYLIREFPGCRVQVADNIISFLPSGARVDMKTINWLTSDYLLYLPDEPAQRYDKEVIRFLENNKGAAGFPFEPVAVSVLPNGRTVKLLRQQRRPTAAEAMDYISLLDIHPGAKELLIQEVNEQLKGNMNERF